MAHQIVEVDPDPAEPLVHRAHPWITPAVIFGGGTWVPA
jgi:hypothetical protein